ncbi:MAG TPA: phage tail tape measure protein [Acidimicrobiia bacterium]
MARDKSVIQVVVTGEASRLQRAMKGAGSILAGFGVAAVRATAAVASLAAGIGSIAVRQFANFDAAMTKSLAIMGDVSEGMRDDMAMAAREVAKTTTFSAEQAAESYFFLASAGLDAQQSIAALPQVAAFAQAGMFDMSRATDLLTDAQSALGLTSDDAADNLANMARVSDVLVKANTLANATVEQFSESLTNKAGAALRVLGKDIEEGAAVLAFFADQGVKGAEAGETLNIMLRDITRAAAANTDEFSKLGLNVLDSEGNLRNMADVVEEFTRVLGPMSDAQMAATLDQLGLTRAVGNSIRQTLGGADAIREYEAALRDASGVTDEIAGKQLQTFNAQLQLLQSAVGDVFLSIGERLLPILQNMVDALRDNLPAIEAFVDTMLDGFDSKVLPVLRTVSQFIIDNVAPAIGNLANFFMTELVPALRETARWFGEHVVPVLRVLWDFVNRNIIPAFQTFARFVLNTVVPALRNFLEPALQGVREGLSTVSMFVDRNRSRFQGLFAAIRPLFNFLRDTLAPFLGRALRDAFAIVGGAIGGVIEFVGILSTSITKLIDGFKWIIDNARRLRNALPGGDSAPAPAAPTLTPAGGSFTPPSAATPRPIPFVPNVPVTIPVIQPGSRLPTPPSNVTINVTGGMMDPEGVARSVDRVLTDANRRTGGGGVAAFF